MDDPLALTLDITPLESPTPSTAVPAVPDATTIQDDAQLARDNIKSLIEQGAPTLMTLLQIAKDSQHPRAFEVASQLLKTMSELNKDLMDIHEKEKKLTGAATQPSQGSITVKNAVFVGTTKELSETLKHDK